jgi:hypothetical protein
MFKEGRKAVVARAVAAIAAVGLAMIATTGLAAGSVGSVPRSRSTRSTSFTETDTGASITQPDGSFLTVLSVKNSMDGAGAVVSMSKLNGSSGTDTATRYQENGVQRFAESFTLGTAGANGLIPITGHGKCVGPGTGVHKHERCTYTFTGTLNATTEVVNDTVTGTTTR